jgi:hypothetical protein
MTEPLSPAAQAIENAYFNADGFGYRNALAAALRAAADQVAPQNYQAGIDIHSDDDGGWVNGAETRNEEIRAQLLAIAAELEGFN